MYLVVNKEKLDALMRKQGIRNYRDLAHEAKSRGLTLSEGTIYKMLEEPTWTATRLAALCELLHCKPADLIPGWKGNDADTHGSPQSEEELEGQPA